MIKKIILLISTFAIICLAFLIYQSRESAAPPPPVAEQPTNRTAAPPTARGPRSTQPAARLDDNPGRSFSPTDMHIPPGGEATIHVYDPKTGDTKYVFRAPKWEPVGPSGNEFAVTEPSAEVLLPRGQMAYLRADEGHVTVARGSKNNFEPKRGWFKGNVRIIVDKTKPEWRRAHPELAEPYQHPEAIIKFWLDDVRFDIEQANLFSDGPIRMESIDGSLQGRGLELVWNEVNRRITKLRIAEGRQATLRSSNLLGFGVAKGPSQDDGRDTTTRPTASDKAVATVAEVTAPPSAPAVSPDQPRANVPLSLVDVKSGRERLKENRIDAYHLEFRDNIVAEQRDGLRAVGRLKAAVVQVLFEVGQSEREAAQHADGTPPAGKTPRQTNTATAPADERSPLNAGSAVVIDWTGELVIVPEQEEETPDQQRTGKAERLHLIATGNPVELFNRETGEGRCQRLEYHHETKQAWLTGTPEAPIRMASGPDGELVGEQIFFDGKTGVARMDGPGKLIITRAGNGDASLTLGIGDARATAIEDTAEPTTMPVARRQSILAWQKSAEIHFGVASVPASEPGAPEGTVRKGEYLKDAIFDGGVTLTDPDQSMSAEHVEITFRTPQTVADFARDKAVAEHIAARGGVRMNSAENTITCDTLDVALTVDEFGNNIPLTGRAVGSVVARQGLREIHARDHIEIRMASVLRPVTPEQRKLLEARARKRNWTPDSPEWKAFEREFEARHRRTVVTALVAHGQVGVSDPKAKLDVVADDLDCVMNEQQQITRATVLGAPDAPAHVQTSDFYIRGPSILMDAAMQSAKVPGAGLLRFYTSQDLDGRPVDRPVPIVVTWSEHMTLDGQTNEGWFVGATRARSESSTLDCRSLFLRFQDIPRTTREVEGVRSTWVFRAFAGASGRRIPSEITTARVAGQLRKRLTYLRADGAASGDQGPAVMEIKAYDDAPARKGMIARALAAVVPTWLQNPTRAAQPDTRRRLVSGAAISGPRIAVDLTEHQLAVEGKGFLLIRDYRVPSSHGRVTEQGSAQAAVGLSADSLTNYSPGHTGFTWLNGMSFLNQKNVAVFDGEVRVEHRSGSELEMSPELATATGLDVKALATMKGRHVTMTSDHLLAEFERDLGRDDAERKVKPGTLSRATRLKVFVASGRVHMQEGGRSLDGAEVSYRAETGLVRATGTPKSLPQAVDIDPATGQVRYAWRGQLVEWNVNTGDVRGVDSAILAPGR